MSAGLLMYRVGEEHAIEVLLAHPGGPYYAKKDAGVWSIPKGEVDSGEDIFAAAQREFSEETGLTPPEGPYAPLGGVKYKNHKLVYAWAFEGDCDPETLTSVAFDLEWPPRSGRLQVTPEVDRWAFFGLEAAREAILPAQRRFVDELGGILAAESS